MKRAFNKAQNKRSFKNPWSGLGNQKLLVMFDCRLSLKRMKILYLSIMWTTFMLLNVKVSVLTAPVRPDQ